MSVSPSHSPSLAHFREAAAHGNLVPVWREIVLDGDTPVSAYARLGRRDHSFLLESVVGGEKWAAYSFIGVAPRAFLRLQGGTAEVTTFSVEDGGPERTLRFDAPDPLPALERFLA